MPKDYLALQTPVDYLTGTHVNRKPDSRQLARLLIRQLLPTGVIGLGDIALHLGVHPKALQRRLGAEGTTFGELVEQTRREAAERLLSDTDLSLDLLSRQLGYAEQSVFTRSCKRWFGVPSSAYRLSRREI
ncbi:AraC-like DNA-binding protein [Mycobacteroides chelonae]|nr:AraC-like DNA-binding protein [Mycobacteroides chelonae]